MENFPTFFSHNSKFMCPVRPDELHDKSAARQTPPGRQRGCPSVLPSISAILGQQQLPNATMSRVDFLIYSGTKFPPKIFFCFPSDRLTQPGISTVLPYLLEREGGREGETSGHFSALSALLVGAVSTKEEQVCSSQASRCVACFPECS